MTLRPSTPRVLVADDQGDILEALRLLLTDAGFDADLVSTVGDVESHVAEQTYDLVLMDLNYTRDTTSGREGLDLVDRIRARDAALPIVVMTGWGSIDTAVEAMRRGARGFVQKPWDDATLVEVVRREVHDGRVVRNRDARTAREQEEARLIQRALLPAVMPDLDGCTLAAVWTPASGIGGDCYDVMRFSPTRAAIAIADVIGHGLPAALLMSNLQAAVRAFATPAAEPHDVCTSVNRLLCRNVAAGKFVSFCYAVVDLTAGTVVYANAGHNPPALVRADGRVDRFDRTGLVLGVTADWTYTSGTSTLDPGDRLVFFTDGITEAASADDAEFGDDRLIDTIRRHRREPADTLARSLSEAVSTWTGGTFQDDATLIVLARE
jgi:sigma-B regulation protein RsbU (phosphoserine phosphatase)